MRRTKEEAEKTREDLLDAAMTVFSKKGYESSRLEDVAEAAGVTRGAIYHHFGNKADLYMALIENASTQGEDIIQKATEEGGTFAEIVSRILTYSFSLLEDNSRFRDVVELSLFKTGISHDLEALARRRYDEARILVENIGRLFQTAIANGQLRPDLDPEAAARALLAYQNGLAMLWLANSDAFSIKADAPALVDVFLGGIVMK